MALYQDGSTVAVGDHLVVVGRVDRIHGDDETVLVDLGQQSVHVPASETMPVSALLGGGGGATGIDWEIDDPFDSFEGNRWNNAGTGDGSTYAWKASTQTWLLNDESNGYLRLTCGPGSTSGDRGRIYHDQVDFWNTLFGIREQRFVWRVGLNAITNIRASVGLCRAIPAVARPSPSVVFLFDSTEGFRLQHDDGAGKTSDASAGSLDIFNQKFAEVELRTVAGKIDAYVNGSKVGSIDSDLPTGDNACLSPFGYVEGAGTTFRSIALDRFRYGRAVA